jgi:hypothetical protein
MVHGLFMCSGRCFVLTFPKFVVERGPIGQMMHAGFSRWMAGEALACLILAYLLHRLTFSSRQAIKNLL